VSDGKTRRLKVLAGSLGECVHVGGVVRFLQMAESEGYQTEFTGPATSVADFIAAIERFDPDIVGVSYRLTPENAGQLLADLKLAVAEAGLAGKRYAFGGTPPVAEVAREVGLFEAVFSGKDPPEAVLAYLRGRPLSSARPADYPDELIPRIAWKAPFPLLRHHFGLPGRTIMPTVRGIRKIAEAGVLDIVSLGPDQDAQENFFHPERQDPRSKGAGGVPFRSEKELRELYAASRRGNYPLMRSYSGTADHLLYADMLRRTIKNAWCATSVFWFNAMDGRGPEPLRDSIASHLALMKWHGERNVPVEANEPHHWGLRDAPDAVSCASAYLSAYANKAMGVRDYIAQLMFETPPLLSNRMDLAKMLAMARLAESLADGRFRVWRQTRNGLFSFPVDADKARAQLAQSIYLQMALRPHIIHVVSYVEADHAATPEDVIEACKMASWVAETALQGAPDLAADPAVQRRCEQLIEEATLIVEAIRGLGRDVDGDPLIDPATLARAVEIGLLDAPHLRGNAYAAGLVRTRPLDGALVAVDDEGRPVPERERISRLSGKLQGP
jgi:methylmalonyl-CoA mutase cobalamin-binding subunit